MRRFPLLAALLVLVLLILLAAPFNAADAQEATVTVEKSRITLENFANDKNNVFFQENLKKAKGILIFPQVLKSDFFWGGAAGTGVLSVRNENTGEWSQPVFYTISSVSFGSHMGAQTAEVVMLAMNKKAVDMLYASSVKLGGDMSVIVGPYGTDFNKHVIADFFSFAMSRGLYAGLDLQGSGLAVRDDLNKAYYGKEMRPVDIIVQKEVSDQTTPQFLDVLRTR